MEKIIKVIVSCFLVFGCCRMFGIGSIRLFLLFFFGIIILGSVILGIFVFFY